MPKKRSWLVQVLLGSAGENRINLRRVRVPFEGTERNRIDTRITIGHSLGPSCVEE
jgi:hypothetical protein